MQVDWLKIVEFALSIFASWLLVTFTPVADVFIRKSLSRSSPWIKEMLNKMYAKEIAENEKVHERVWANSDALEFIRAAVMEQGREMPKLSGAVREMTTAVHSLTEAVDSVKEIASLARESNIRLEEQVKAWERQRYEDRANYSGPPRRASDHI